MEGFVTYQTDEDLEAAKVFKASVQLKWDHASRRMNKEKPGVEGLITFAEVCSIYILGQDILSLTHL